MIPLKLWNVISSPGIKKGCLPRKSKGLITYYIMFFETCTEFWGWWPPQLVVTKGHNIIDSTGPPICSRRPSCLFVSTKSQDSWSHRWLCSIRMYPNISFYWIEKYWHCYRWNIVFSEVIERLLLYLCVHLWKRIFKDV